MTGAVVDPQGDAAAPPANRMAIAILALIGVLISAYMSMYAIGAIDSVACGTGACEVVQKSPWSVFLGVPVPFIGVGGYGTVFALAMAGTRPGRTTHRGIGVALLVLACIATAFSAWLSWAEAMWIQAWCRWCIASAVVSTLLLLASLPEINRLLSRKDRP